MQDEILAEARRLWKLGFAIHWLRPRSKIPVEPGWTTGPRKDWNDLHRTYRQGYNVGVRLGTPSKVGNRYLAVIDLDIKSKSERHRTEALSAARRLMGGRRLPIVRSGRGNGSRHFYFLSKRPFKTYNPAVSRETVKVYSPSKKPSRQEVKSLTLDEIKGGIRLSHAWEVSLYSEGRQVVLPPSIHPDSGKAYLWSRPYEKPPVLSIRTALSDTPSEENDSRIQNRNIELEGFVVEAVELEWLPISETVRAGILHGTGVSDRSAFLLKASSALLSAGLTQNEALSVLTDPKTYLGGVGYDHAKTTSRKRAAEWVYKYSFEKIVKERSETVFTIPVAEARKLSPEEMEKDKAQFQEERDWRQDIAFTQQGLPHKTVQNVVHIISNDVGSDIVRRDEFAFRDTYSKNTVWGGKEGDVVSDDDVATIKYWLGVNFKFEPTNNTISDSLIVLARRNAFDPVKDWLRALPKWDKTPRLDTWLSRNFEAQGDPEYLAQVFRKWMVAMVMRVYRPGSKFDWMPIFEGAQGIGKSSFGRILVGDKYFLDWLPNLNDKDAPLSLQGMWGVEMGELSQFRRNELENIKAFLSRPVDKLRPPYGRRLIESPRRCVFFGTTNRQTYLVDETGNRRFKPVVVGNLNFKALRAERLQLFAEAKFLFLKKIETETSLELTGRARIYEQQIHHEKMVEDDSHSMEESMRDFIEKVHKKEVNFDLEKFKIIDLFQGVGCLGNWKKENRNLQFCAKMLKRVGAKDRFIKGRKYWKIENDSFF